MTEQARQEGRHEVAGKPRLAGIDGPHGPRQRCGDGGEGQVAMSAQGQRIDGPGRGGGRVDHDKAPLPPPASQHGEESGERRAVGRNDDDPWPEAVRDRDGVDRPRRMSDDAELTIRRQRAHA
jgi:hypothetical protein